MESRRETSSAARRGTHYPHVLYVRATEDERRRIQALARDAGLSASRYLARLAAQGRPPPTQEEREDLRSLRYYLEKVGGNLSQIANRTGQAWLRGEPPPEQVELQAVLRGVAILSRELRRRLR